MNHKISVCMATYNGERFIVEQLKSILPQLGPDDEVVVSDDGSTDRTIELIRSLGDARIKVFQGPCAGSPITNFENALKHASGDFVFLSDQDDVWLEGKVEAVVEALAGGAGCVVTDCRVTDEALNVTHPSFFALNHHSEGRFSNLFVRNQYLGCCMAFTKAVKDKSLPFPRRIAMHDIWIGNVAAFSSSVRFIHTPYSLYRRGHHNVTLTSEKSQYSLSKKLQFRLRMAFEVFRRCWR